MMSIQQQPSVPVEDQSALSQWWQSIMDIPGASWIIWISLLIVLILFAVYFASLFRNLALGERTVDETDHLGEFRRLREQGLIDDEEYNRLANVVPIPIPDAKPAKDGKGFVPSAVNPAPLQDGGSAAVQAMVPKKPPITLAEAQRRKQESQNQASQAGQTTSADDSSDGEIDSTT